MSSISVQVPIQVCPRGAPPGDVAIDSKHLGLSSAERRLVTGQAGRTQPELWGYPAGAASWTERLSCVTELLARSGLSFAELLDLLHVTWVNPSWKLGLVSPEGASHYGLAQMRLQDATLAPPDGNFYDRARRFVWLWRKLGWPMLDLDKALIALGAVEIDDAVIESLSYIQRIQAAMRIDLLSLLSLWSDIDMKLDRPGRDVAIVPLYDRVFLNRAVITEETSWPFRLNAACNLVLTGPLSAWTVELQAALGVTAEELDEVLDLDMKLTIPTLSRLYRTVVLARALKLTVGDLLAFRDLFAQLDEPADPFVANDGIVDTRATLRFIEEVRAAQGAGFTADDLLYLLGQDVEAALAVGPDEAAQAAFLAELRAGLQAIEAEAVVEPEPTGGITPPRRSGIVDLAAVRKERLVQSKIASFLGIVPDQSSALLVLAPASVLGEPTGAGAADLLGVLLGRGFIDAPVLETASDHRAAFATLTLLDKIAKAFGKLAVGIEEQTWLLSAGIAAGMLDPSSLPLAAATNPAVLYPRWRALREALRVRAGLPQVGATAQAQAHPARRT